MELDSQIPGLKRIEISIPMIPASGNWINFTVRLSGN